MITEQRSEQVFRIVTGQLRVVCAWCKAEMKPGPESPVSHGMCKSCYDHETAQLDLRGK